MVCDICSTGCLAVSYPHLDVYKRQVRGRKASIRALFKKMEEHVVSPEGQMIYISHGDCEEEARTLADMIRQQWPVKDIVLNHVGPVIGAHTGPGVIALFFLGDVR